MPFNTSILRMLYLFFFRFVISLNVRFIEVRFKIFPLSLATYFKFEFN